MCGVDCSEYGSKKLGIKMRPNRKITVKRKKPKRLTRQTAREMMIPDEVEVTVPEDHEVTVPEKTVGEKTVGEKTVGEKKADDETVGEKKADDETVEEKKADDETVEEDLPSVKQTNTMSRVTVVLISIVLSAVWLAIFFQILKLTREYTLF